tara:strand:- start:4 stop:228 length:225 start_codon:yes stop_codon:yes gene_type:complete
MGAFRRPKMEESEADKQLRKDIERRRKEEEEEKIRLEKEQKKQKARRKKGMVGQRSLFTKGTKGMTDPEGKTYE